MIDLNGLTGLTIYPASVSEADGTTYFLGRRQAEKLVGCLGRAPLPSAAKVAEVGGQCVCVGPTNHANAVAVRAALSWTAPRCIGLATSAGLGDRLGLATPGHIRAIRNTKLAAVLAQQSIREMTRTQRTADEVMDAATWGVLQEGFRGGFGSDADHLQKTADIDCTVAAGFTMFTIDPGQHVVNGADGMDAAALGAAFSRLDFDTLGVSPDDLKRLYLDKVYALDGGGKVRFDEASLLRPAVKYGSAIAHTVKMFRHLHGLQASRATHVASASPVAFELEVSVDETDTPTTPAEHYFFAAELKRLGVKWVSMAPRFVGRFEKGVDYIGDLATFRRSFAAHVAVMRTLGPYKISIHSGSDKFSIYPIVAELAGPYVHLKTAGTSYLEAVRAIAYIDPKLFREILDFAHQRYGTDKASYHVSAEPSKVPQAKTLRDADLPGVLDLFDGRQLLHVTFGSVLTARNPDGSSSFRERILSVLRAQEETHYQVLQRHIARHLAAFAD